MAMASKAQPTRQHAIESLSAACGKLKKLSAGNGGGLAGQRMLSMAINREKRRRLFGGNGAENRKKKYMAAGGNDSVPAYSKNRLSEALA